MQPFVSAYASQMTRYARVMEVFLIILCVAATASQASLEVAPSPSQSTNVSPVLSTTTTLTQRVTSPSRSADSSVESISPSLSQATLNSASLSVQSTSVKPTTVYPLVPSQTPHVPHHTCQTGPKFERVRYTLLVTDRLYLDLSEPVNCTGVITSWYYCFIVISFRNTPASLLPCVWRKSNHSEGGYERVGCNNFTFTPGQGDEVRCKLSVPMFPSEFLRVEEGDYIGFYLPDSGLIPALSASEFDSGHYQLERNESGFASFINESELILASSSPGRALLRAEIDSDWKYPSLTPTTTPTPTAITTEQPSISTQPTPLSNIGLAVSLVVALGVTVVLTITVIALIAYVNCKQRCCSEYEAFPQGPNSDMDYNDIYKFRSANHVVVGNKRTFVNLNDNPAYESIPTSPSLLPGQTSRDTESSTPRRQLEHTYESLSNFHVHATNVNR